MSDRSGPGTPLLEVKDLTVEFPARGGPIRPVDRVSFTLDHGGLLGLVGESGSGKSVTSLAITGLTGATGGRVVEGSVMFDGVDLLALSPRQRSEILGRDIGMIFQQPIRSLNPTTRVGDQIVEAILRHEKVGRKDAWNRAVDLLARVGIVDPAQRAREYPFTFSGGMAQRVMIAMALACGPKLLIADEPTTALDVTVQAQVLELIQELRRDLGLAVLLVTHDLGVVSEVCESLVVMYCGQVVEQGTASEVLMDPSHPYTRGLLAAVPVRGSTRRLIAIRGTVPSPAELPPGCRFNPRCPLAEAGVCDAAEPELATGPKGRPDRCFHPELTAGSGSGFGRQRIDHP